MKFDQWKKEAMEYDQIKTEDDICSISTKQKVSIWLSRQIVHVIESFYLFMIFKIILLTPINNIQD
jgi:hypothetical protein